jgi:hypothetical protein
MLNIFKQRASRCSGRAVIEMLEDRRLLSASIVSASADTALAASTPSADNVSSWTPDTYGSIATAQSPFTFAAVPGVPFSGRVGVFGGGSPARIVIDWGDGTPFSNATFSPIENKMNAIDGSHTYAAAGTYNVWILGYNADGSAFVNMGPMLSVAEVAAPGAAAPPSPANQGEGPQYISLNLTAGVQFSGPVATAFMPTNNIITINWGDGASSPGTEVPNGDGSYAIVGTHVYATPGQYMLGIPWSWATLSGVTSQSSGNPVNVSNPAPPTGNSFDAANGMLFQGNVALLPALASTPQSVSIDWGEGTPPSDGTYTLSGDGKAIVSGSHTYATAGNFTVTISDVQTVGAAPVVIGQSTAVVIPVYTRYDNSLVGPLQAAQEFDGQISQQIELPFPVSSAAVAWGDGTQTPITFTTDAQGSFWYVNFFGSHTYATPGTYSFTVSVTPSPSPLMNANPIVVSQGSAWVSPNLTLSGTAGQPFEGNVATFPAPGSAPSSVVIDWGDGTPTTAGAYVPDPGNAGYADITGTHTYASTGSYNITVREGSSVSAKVIAVSSIEVAIPGSVWGSPPYDVWYPTLVTGPTNTPAPAINTVTAPAIVPSTTGVAGVAINAAWSTTPHAKKSAGKLLTGPVVSNPTVLIEWGEGKRYAGSADFSSTTGQLTASGQHTYRRAGVYRAVAVFMENGKVIRRVSKRLTIRRSSSR